MRSTALSSRLVIVHSNPSCQQLQCSCTSVKLHCRYTVQQHSKEVTVYSTGLILQQHSSAVTEQQSNTHSSICNSVVTVYNSGLFLQQHSSAVTVQQSNTVTMCYSSIAAQLQCCTTAQHNVVTVYHSAPYSIVAQLQVGRIQIAIFT